MIELKVGKDEDLVFQSVYYRLKIKERFKTNHVRMITVAPYYSSRIKESLEALKDVEMYIFDAKVKNKKIIDLKLIKSA